MKTLGKIALATLGVVAMAAIAVAGYRISRDTEHRLEPNISRLHTAALG